MGLDTAIEQHRRREDALPSWATKILMTIVLGVSGGAAHWVFGSITTLQEEAAVNRAVRTSQNDDMKELKTDVKRLLEAVARKP